MPKAPATPEEIQAVRDHIIQEAVSLINEDGYVNFSMRKLGARLGIAAKTIYNYFQNKDELYLNILMHGFENLFNRMRAAERNAGAPHAKILAMARAYVGFGLEHPHHYNILFSMDVPKYADYVGTPHQELAEQQNRSALEIARLGERIFTDLIVQTPGLDPATIPYYLMKTWTTLHGIVSLQNSRVTREVGDYAPMIDRIIQDAVSVFSP